MLIFIRKPVGEPLQDYFSDIGPIYFLPEKFDNFGFGHKFLAFGALGA